MSRDSKPPAEFVCPLTHNLMEHPVSTSLGHTYEYAAISRWLSNHSTDPVTNESLKSKVLNKNLALRSLIQSWIKANPQIAARHRSVDAVPPPPPPSASATEAPKEGGSLPPSLTNEANLGKIITYKGSHVKKTKAQRIAAGDAPASVSTGGLTYEFRRLPPRGTEEVNHFEPLEIRWFDGRICGEWMPLPVQGATAVFATPQGLVFYNPKEISDARVSANDADAEEPGVFASKAPCKFNPCTKAGCTFGHAIACRFGVVCRDQASCKMLHPDPSSVVPLGDKYPLNTECKYATGCTSKGCHFAHPKGRLARADRIQKPYFATHNANLTPLSNGPAVVDVGEAPAAATAVAFQGSFVFFYTPYPGAWAREHYKTVTVHRFDAKTQRYGVLGSYELEGHYCNTAVGSHNFFVLSWWPFEDEAMRAIWEAGRQLREQNKALEAKERELEALEKESARAIAAKDAALQAKEKEAAAASKDAARALGAKQAELARQAHELARKDKKIDALQAKAAKQAGALAAKDAALQAKEKEAAAASKDAARALGAKQAALVRKDRMIDALQAKASERARQWAAKASERAERLRAESEWRARRAKQQAARARADRSERFRLMDPIHVYALEPGKSGVGAADWTLVLDYHKGAHALELLAPNAGTAASSGRSAGSAHAGASSSQRLRVTEHSNVFEFDLLLPANFRTIGKLPIVPGRLCDGF
jgi:hypothetical protein